MKKQFTHKINFLSGVVAGLLAFNCQAETTQAGSASLNLLRYESSLSEFKSINNDAAKLSANGSAQDMKGMDHSKMGADEMKDMKGMDHSKMGADEMKDMKGMKGMDHSKMGADEMKDMKAEQKKSVKPAKVKKLKSMKKTAKPMPPDEVLPTAPANPHQDHQM